MKPLTEYKPSEIVRAMTEGLRTIPNGNFKIDMATFGGTDDGVCFGCAATCTLQHLAGKRFTPETIDPQSRALVCSVRSETLDRFEEAVDGLRVGFHGWMEDLPTPTPEPELDLLPVLPHLGNDYTETQLQAYDKYADQLEGIGL